MKKSLRRSIIVIVLLALSITAGVLYERVYLFVEKRLNPMPETIVSAVERYSLLYGVPQNIIYATIKNESSFITDAQSHRDARGLMQITTDTFVWLQSKTKEEYPEEALYDAEINIKYGTFYLSMLYNEFLVWETAYAAYNAGPTRVREWLKNESYSENGRLTNIPFAETANYVKKVSDSAILYQRLYFGDAET